MDPPTMEELDYHIQLLPNGKATGPSKISYEMIKHLSIEMKTIIKDLMTDCFRLRQIPSFWKLANVYPIPKPKPWCCDLSNTRPITLLDTVRKLMVSILNRRCGKILKDNKILKGNQFAGLPESSTFEPVRIINEILTDANEEDQEFWMLSLDMSKAYDRVNIFMLRKAMHRLKLPIEFTELICNLFLNRKNQ